MMREAWQGKNVDELRTTATRLNILLGSRPHHLHNFYGAPDSINHGIQEKNRPDIAII
jgi:hypothetical protein